MVAHTSEDYIQSSTQQDFPDFAWIILEQHFPEFGIAGLPEALSGGLMNYVWRVRGLPSSRPASIIVKWAPAYIASAPDVWLDPDRILIEARAMSVLANSGKLQAIPLEDVRPAHLYNLDAANHLIVMEDFGQSPDLGKWLNKPHSQEEAQAIGVSLGQFIGRLHKASAAQPGLAPLFNNHAIQRTRREFQYGNIQAYAQLAGLAEAEELGRRAIWLGERLLQPGICLTMGDLWPASIMVVDPGLRIIDWELAHYGRPAQDIGHLSAHLWMVAHRAQNSYTAENAKIILNVFLKTYRQTLGSQFSQLFGEIGVIESSVHFGSEIFTRAVGAFQKDYVYSGLAPDDPAIQAAVQCAVAHISSPLDIKTFDPLGWRVD